MALRDRFALAAYASDAASESLLLTMLDRTGATMSSDRRIIEARAQWQRLSEPGLGIDADRWAVAFIDGSGSVLAGGGSLGTMPTLARIGDSADPRFVPSVGWRGRDLIVAFTAPHPTGMEVRVAIGSTPARPVTARSMSAASPTIVSSSDETSVVFLDAHQGLSPLLRASLLADGTLGPTETLAVLANVAEPLRIAVSRVGTRFHIAYTATGSGGTSAIGWLVGPGGVAPRALVPGRGYGLLSMSLTTFGGTVLSLAERPLEARRDAPRVLELRGVSEDGLGEVALVHGPHGTGILPSVAALSDGTTAVSFIEGGTLYVQVLDCADAVPPTNSASSR